MEAVGRLEFFSVQRRSPASRRRSGAIQPKNYLPRTSDGRADRPSANLLAQQSLPTQPNQACAGDITFIPTVTGWLYLAVVIDLGSRRIIGWSLDTHMRCGSRRACLATGSARALQGSRPKHSFSQ